MIFPLLTFHSIHYRFETPFSSQSKWIENCCGVYCTYTCDFFFHFGCLLFRPSFWTWFHLYVILFVSLHIKPLMCCCVANTLEPSCTRSRMFWSQFRNMYGLCTISSLLSNDMYSIRMYIFLWHNKRACVWCREAICCSKMHVPVCQFGYYYIYRRVRMKYAIILRYILIWRRQYGFRLRKSQCVCVTEREEWDHHPPSPTTIICTPQTMEMMMIVRHGWLYGKRKYTIESSAKCQHIGYSGCWYGTQFCWFCVPNMYIWCNFPVCCVAGPWIVLRNPPKQM